MVHRLERFKSAYNQVEELWYTGTGIASGIAGSTTSRDLQDYYIGKRKTRFQKPGFNARKWERYYTNRYHPYKRRFKGDVLIEESNKLDKTYSTGDSYNNNRGNKNFYSYSGRKSALSRRRRSRRSPNRCHCKSNMDRAVAKRSRYLSR